MKRTFLLAAAASFALLAGPALADKGHSESNSDNAATAAQSGSAQSAKADPKICRRYENSASRMRSQQLCLTKEQWRKFDAGNYDGN